MKKVLFFLLFALALPIVGAAQNVALGERVPELRLSTWLSGSQPALASLTYIEFFHSSNKACITSMERLRELSNKFGTKLRVVVVTREKEDKIAPMLQGFLSTRIGVGFDSDGKIHSAFGVNYLPFGVLVDSKNRALWMGNTLQLTPDLVEKSSL